jgi:hypothetical protein
MSYVCVCSTWAGGKVRSTAAPRALHSLTGCVHVLPAGHVDEQLLRSVRREHERRLPWGCECCPLDARERLDAQLRARDVPVVLWLPEGERPLGSVQDLTPRKVLKTLGDGWRLFEAGSPAALTGGRRLRDLVHMGPDVDTIRLRAEREGGEPAQGERVASLQVRLAAAEQVKKRGASQEERDAGARAVAKVRRLLEETCAPTELS